MKPKTLIGVLALLTIIGNWGCQKGDFKEVGQYTIEQFQATKSIFGSSFSPDESEILFTSNASGVFNAYTISIEGGEPTQVTNSTDNAIYAISFFPQDKRILYRSDQEGNEISHLLVRNEDGSVTDLISDPKARAEFYGWSHDEKSFYFGTNSRNPKYMDFYQMDIATFTPKLIYRNDAGYDLGAVSNDQRFMAFGKTITRANSDMYLYDIHNKTLKHLSAHQGEVNYVPVAFSVDSRSLYFLTDEDSEFTYLKRYDIETGQTEKVEATDWDILYASFSHNGKYRVVGINNDGRTEIKVYDTGTGAQVELPVIPNVNFSSVNISKSERLMTVYLNGSRSPNNLYVYDFESRHFKKLTETMTPEIDPSDLVEARVVRYPSFDARPIPAILYKPHQIKPGEKAPAVIWVHGGPGGQSRIGYNARFQYLANHGYVVLAVNNRGSSGYGKTFFKLDDLKHGEDDLDDCVEAKKFLVSTGYVDANKIAIAGGSYGGYMVVAALAFRPQEFAAGVDLFGVTNWVRTLKSVPPWWEAFKNALYQELGNPETDEDYLRRISPLFHADKITKPLIVLQGANDPRVLKTESDEIVAAVKKNGVPVEYVVFPDEGHGFRKKKNQIKGWKAILNFLDEHVKGQTGQRPQS
ncbi:MAG: alpha/beta fold hydrolase [bacterium]